VKEVALFLHPVPHDPFSFSYFMLLLRKTPHRRWLDALAWGMGPLIIMGDRCAIHLAISNQVPLPFEA
jgi:hypothetical protein